MWQAAGLALLGLLALALARQRSLPRRSRKRASAARYARQSVILGRERDARLRQARVLVVGAGGLASSAVPLLAGAGVGALGICDDDVVEESNLHRQTMHGERWIGRFKVDSCEAFVRGLNSDVAVEKHRVRVDLALALELVPRYHVVLDCSDNVDTRYALNDACVNSGVPLVSGAALGTSGQVCVFWPSAHPSRGCLRCAFPAPLRPEDRGSCGEDGVLGPVPGLVGCLQALEAIKLLSGWGEAGGSVIALDLEALDGDSWGRVRQVASATCEVCGPDPRPPCPLDADVPVATSVDPRTHVIVDVRSSAAAWAVTTAAVRVEPDLHVSLREIREDPARALGRILQHVTPARGKVLLVCERGHASLVAASLLRKARPDCEVYSLAKGLKGLNIW